MRSADEAKETALNPRFDPDAVRSALPETLVVGRQILVFEATDSTNDLAARAGEDGLREGLTIFAESQRSGRGTSGRRWLSPPRQNLLFSVLLRPVNIPIPRWPELTFCAALAVAEAAEQATSTEARIKWPNDVLVGGRKVAGILLESHQRKMPGFVVLGIGLNVLQREADFDPDLRDRAGSLQMAVCQGHDLRREPVAASVLKRLDDVYCRWPQSFADIMAACIGRGCHQPEA